MEYKRQQDEAYLDYFVRLHENKKEYGLNSDSIAELLNHENGNNYGESTYRKEYAAFNRGRMYERDRNLVGIATRILSISDFHVPFQLPIETFRNYQNRVDILQINGDVTDCQAISKFPKAYRVSPMEEIIKGRQYLMELIEYIQPRRVVINYGNHDTRFQAYFNRHLDSDILELMPQTALDLVVVDGFNHYDKRRGVKTWYEPLQNVFTDIKVEYTGDWKCKIGKTWFAHPTAFSSGTLKTCEKAMDFFFKEDREDFDTIVLGHTHRTAHSKNGYINLFEQGAACDVNQMKYNNGRLIAPQKEGFLYLCQDKDGSIIEEHTQLVYLN